MVQLGLPSVVPATMGGFDLSARSASFDLRMMRSEPPRLMPPTKANLVGSYSTTLLRRVEALM